MRNLTLIALKYRGCCLMNHKHWKVISWKQKTSKSLVDQVGGGGISQGRATPTLGPISLIFTQFLGNNCPDIGWPSRVETPGSVTGLLIMTDMLWLYVVNYHQIIHVNSTIRTWVCSGGLRISQMGLEGANPWEVDINLLFRKIFAENCMKTTPSLGSTSGMVIKPMWDFHSSHM